MTHIKPEQLESTQAYPVNSPKMSSRFYEECRRCDNELTDDDRVNGWHDGYCVGCRK